MSQFVKSLVFERILTDRSNTDVSFVGFLPKWPQQPDLSHSDARNQELLRAPMVVAVMHVLEAWSVTYYSHYQGVGI